jgi:hypothetical protein
VSSLCLAQHLGCAGRPHATDLVLQGEVSAAHTPEILDLVPELLRRLAELRVAGDVNFAPFKDELGAAGGIVGDRRQGRG